jgi:glycosyltransferase involved in cell wall biosynthesis
MCPQVQLFWGKDHMCMTDQKWQEGEVPLVTIRCITFNHVHFIRDAIEGFLMQKTNFPVEIIIHDDASTDGTAEIVRDYAKRYPRLIKTILQTENQTSKNGGSGKKFARKCIEEKTRGKYIALCDGDDYWTDSKKLQKQVDVLEEDPSYMLAFCNLKVLYDNPEQNSHEAYQEKAQPAAKGRIAIFAHPKQRTSFIDIMKGNYVHTSGVLFRNLVYEKDIPDYMANMPIYDWSRYLIITQKGNLYYSREIMGVYRVHAAGMWSRRSKFQQTVMSLGQYPPLIRCELFANQYKWHWLRKAQIQFFRGLKLADTTRDLVLIIFRVAVPLVGSVILWWLNVLFRVRYFDSKRVKAGKSSII